MRSNDVLRTGKFFQPEMFLSVQLSLFCPEELGLDITSFEFAALSTSYYIYPPPAGSFSILLHGARLSNRII